MNPWGALRGLPRQVWVLCAATLVNRLGTMARPFLVLYLTQQRGYSEGRAGFVLTCYAAAALLIAPIAGRACDSFGALRIMRGSLLLSGSLLLLLPFVTSFAGTIVFIVAWAAIAEAYRPANLTILAELAPEGQTRAVLALNRMAINLGMSVGPVVGGVLAGVSYAAVFWVDGGMSILAGLVLATGSRAWDVRPQRRPAIVLHANALLDRRLLYTLAALIPVIAVFFQHMSTMPLVLVRNLHWTPRSYGLLILVNTVLILLFEVAINVAMARWPHGRSLALGAFLSAAGFGAMAFAHSVAAVAGTIVLWTFGEMILFPGSAAYMAEIAPRGRGGEYMGLYQMAGNVAFMIGPWLGTELLERWGAGVLWAAMFVLGSISAAMLARIRET